MADGVFDGCTSLENIKLSKKISALNRYVFRNCINLKNIQLPNSLTNIQEEAFMYCSGLTNIDIPDSVTKIGHGAFYGCASLININIPDSITNMDTSRTFCECSSLTTIKIPDVVTEIGYEAFKGCNSLNHVILKRNITKINKTAFDYSSAVVLCNKNSNAHKDAENNKVSYILDDDPPEVTLAPNGNTKRQKSVKVKVSAADKMVGLEEDSLRYVWSMKDSVTKEEITTKFENGGEINSPKNVTGNYYLYVYAKDKLDNETIIKSKAYQIDNTAPKLTVNYSATELTNKDIAVTVTADEEIQGVTGWTLSKDKKSITKIYTQNTTEDAVIMDVAGNEASTKIKIENIDRVSPILKIQYNTTEPMVESVIATITANEELQELEGWILSDDKKSINKEYTNNINQAVLVKDIAGNESSIQVVINNIKDTTPPNLRVNYSTTSATNKNVKVTITANEEIQEVTGWTLSTDKKTLTKTYSQNIEEEITVKDLVGNETKQPITINNIDKAGPTLKIEYSTTSATNKNVTVTITANEEIQGVTGWTLSTDKKTLTKTYSKNTEEEITVKDLVGNETKQLITINNIDKVAPTLKIEYSTTSATNKNVTVTITSNKEIQSITGWELSTDKKTLTKTYTQNTEEEITVKDLIGNETKQKITINNIVQINADINGDNKIDTGDVISLLRHIAQEKDVNIASKHPKWKLSEEKIISGDINKNDQIDLGDVIIIQRYVAAKSSQEIANKHPEWLQLTK